MSITLDDEHEQRLIKMLAELKKRTAPDSWEHVTAVVAANMIEQATRSDEFDMGLGEVKKSMTVIRDEFKQLLGQMAKLNGLICSVENGPMPPEVGIRLIRKILGPAEVFKAAGL